MAPGFSSLSTAKLIEEVHKRPPLWDTSLHENSYPYYRKKMWREIVDVFAEQGGETGACTKRELETLLIQRWKCIRGCFTRELARQEKLQNGKSCGPRKKEYVYFKKLQFLRNNVKLRNTKESCSSTTSSISEEEVEEIKADNNSVKVEKVELEIEQETEQLQNFDTSVDASLAVKDPLEQDEDRMFLLSLLSAMKRVPEEQKLATRIKIMSAINDAIPNT
ncbi:uncharacterized protein LOC114358361 [Ostrinia furnacalis]|uniref:uncharacterized protein LOC114358361 n=1 Tax=Ostrinia furnacalis TaxID=93504 RepID=UPI00103DB1CE|nr:uncharacterized protein LOC114358361 [Ostrinia furnacalis]